MQTVQDCIDGLHVSYPQVEASQALIYFRQIHQELIALAQIELGSEIVAVNAGQREYALDQTDRIVNVRAAYFQKSATDVHRLTPVSTDWLDENVATWRTSTETGSPVRFYIEDGVVGLDPVPNAATVAGFPILKLFGSTYQALVPTDPIPEIVPGIRVYVEGMKKLYASDRDPANFGAWDDAHKRELHAALSHINGQVEDLESPRLFPVWMRSRRVE